MVWNMSPRVKVRSLHDGKAAMPCFGEASPSSLSDAIPRLCWHAWMASRFRPEAPQIKYANWTGWGPHSWTSVPIRTKIQWLHFHFLVFKTTCWTLLISLLMHLFLFSSDSSQPQLKVEWIARWRPALGDVYWRCGVCHVRALEFHWQRFYALLAHTAFCWDFFATMAKVLWR